MSTENGQLECADCCKSPNTKNIIRQKFYMDRCGKKKIAVDVWCSACTQMYMPGLCMALPASTCQNQNQVIIIRQTTGEERFSCLPCSTCADVQKLAFVPLDY